MHDRFSNTKMKTTRGIDLVFSLSRGIDAGHTKRLFCFTHILLSLYHSLACITVITSLTHTSVLLNWARAPGNTDKTRRGVYTEK